MKNLYGQLPFPTELAFEPVQLCNASCFCCPYSWLKDDDAYRGKTMSREQIRQLLDEFGSVRKTHGYKGQLSVNPFRFSDPLVCKDLDLIFDRAEAHDFNIVITTNGAALSGKVLELLDRYANRMMKLSVSFIGSTSKDIKDLMGLNFEKVLINLDEIANHWPRLRQIIRVSLRKIHNTPEEHAVLLDLQARFKNKGIVVKAIHEQWMTNRIDAQGFTVGQKPTRLEPVAQTSQRFVSGCGWSNHLLERMEVMVDGSVVLCCDDAEKHKVFGNVFRESIASIWNGALRQEHLQILAQEFSEEKCSLICSSCTRAVWSDRSVTHDSMIHRSVTKPSTPAGDEGNHAYYLRMENAVLQKAVHNLTIKLRQKSTPPSVTD